MVVLDGAIYQVKSDGSVLKITGDVGTPFAVVVPFTADQDETIASAASFEEIMQNCDKYRDSDNLFYAFRIDGHFTHIHTRAMAATLDGLPLAKAAAIQPEFDFKEIDGDARRSLGAAVLKRVQYRWLSLPLSLGRSCQGRPSS